MHDENCHLIQFKVRHNRFALRPNWKEMLFLIIASPIANNKFAILLCDVVVLFFFFRLLFYLWKFRKRRQQNTA